MPGRCHLPSVIDHRHGLQARHEVARQPIERTGLGAGDDDLRLLAAEYPGIDTRGSLAAAALAALLVLAGAQQFEVRYPLGRILRRAADARGREFRWSDVPVHQRHGDRCALLADLGHHLVHAVQGEERALDMAHRLAQRFDRGDTLAEARRELHLVGVLGLGADVIGYGDRQDGEQREEHREQRCREQCRRSPQSACDQSAEQDPRRVGRHPASICIAQGTLPGDATACGGSSQTVGEHGHQAHGDQERRRQGCQEGQRQDLDHGTGRAEVDQRGGQEQDRRGQAAGGDRPHRAPHAQARGFRGIGTALEPPQHRLVDDDAVVDQEAHRQRQADHRDQVQGLAGEVEQGQGDQHAGRDGDAHHRDRPPLAQEQEQHSQRDQVAGETKLGDVADLLLHQFRRIRADHEIEADRRDLGAHLGDLGAQFAPQANEIGALLLEDHDADGGLAVDPERGLLRRVAVLDVGDVAQFRRARGVEARLAQGVQTGEAAVDQDIGAPALPFELAGVVQLLDVPVDAADQALRRHGGRRRARKVHGHRELSPTGAGGIRLADALDGGEARHQQLVGEVEERIAVGIAEHVHHHHEAAGARRLRLRGHHPDVAGVAGLLALHDGCDAAHLQFAHLHVAAGLEAHPVVAPRAVHLAAALRDQRQCRGLGVQRQENLPLDHLGLRTTAEVLHEQGIALQRRHQFHGQPLPRHEAEQ